VISLLILAHQRSNDGEAFVVVMALLAIVLVALIGFLMSSGGDDF